MYRGEGSVCSRLDLRLSDPPHERNGAYQITDPMLLEQLVALVTTEKGGPKTSFVGKSARYILDKLVLQWMPA